MISPKLSSLETEITVQEIFKNLEQVMDPHNAKLILGWTLGNFFMDYILDKYKVYPFLFFYGSAGSGKSTLANWVSSFFGFVIKGIPFGGSSAVGLMRASSSLSMLPIWIEEYRTNDKDINYKNNMLRNIYDRSTAVKGTKTPDEIKTSTGKSTIIISGEETPRDAALNSRCITIPVYRKETTSTENPNFKWMEEKCSQFNGIGHQIMLNRTVLWDKINARIKEYLEGFDLDLQKTSSRSKIHISVIGAICDIFLGEEENFEQFVGRHAIERTNFVHSSQALYVFLDDLINMHNTGDLDISNFCKPIKQRNGKPAAAFWFGGAYKMWQEKYFKFRAEIPMQELMLREHLKHETYFIEMSKARLGVKNQSLSCALLNPSDKNFPPSFKEMLEMAEQSHAIIDESMPLIFGEQND